MFIPASHLRCWFACFACAAASAAAAANKPLWEGLELRNVDCSFSQGAEKSPARGVGQVSVGLVNLAPTDRVVRATVTVRAKDAARVVRADGETRRKGNFNIQVPVSLDIRGAVEMVVEVEDPRTAGRKAEVARTSAVLPEFLEVLPPAYRGMVSTARRDPAVHFAVRVDPDIGEDVAGMGIEAKVLDAAGKEVAVGHGIANGAGDVPFSLAVPADAPAGGYRIAVAASRPGRGRVEAVGAFRIVPVRPGQIFVDQDGFLLDEGRPFFPLGVYHAGGWQLDEYAEMGFNLMQCWSWDWVQNLSTNGARKARLAEKGIRIIYEDGLLWNNLIDLHGKLPPGAPFPFETNAAFRARAEQVLKDPSRLLAMWYLADEVGGKAWVPQLQRAGSYFHALDEDHPTYNLSSGDPDVAPGGDILAFDCYPRYAGGRRPLVSFADTMDRMRAVAGPHKCVIAVPQAFGQKGQPTETPESVRCMSYLGIIHGANGMMWYCWKETGDWHGKRSQGMGWNPATAAVVKALIAEFKALVPALMAPGGRTLRSRETGSIHARICGDARVGRRLVCVNGTEEPCEEVLEVPEIPDGTVLNGLFGGKGAKVRKGTVKVALPASGTAAFDW